MSLDKALRIPLTIHEQCGAQPTKPLLVADAIGMTPTSGSFRAVCGASIAYGITQGGYNANEISLTPLGKRIVAPTEEGDDHLAKVESLLKPRIISEFLQRYNNSRLPSSKIALNVLQEMGVPQKLAQRSFQVILDSAESLGLIRDIKGNKYVDLQASPTGSVEFSSEADIDEINMDDGAEAKESPTNGVPEIISPHKNSREKGVRRVFVTHGRNHKIAEQIQHLLKFGKYDPVLAIEEQTVSKPVPTKIMDEMRTCQAAVIHVGCEREFQDHDGEVHRQINANVLIEIGASMALYEDRFILLVEKGVELPSNLQGLYQVRYTGDELDYEATMRLLTAFNDFQNK